MKYLEAKKLLFVILCNMLIPLAYADSITVTESLTDSLKSSKVGRVTTYSVETSGKFSLTAKISGGTFDDAGIFWEDITEDTTVDISIGDYSFSSTLSAADNLTLTSTKIAAKWSATEPVCDGTDSTTCKDVSFTKVSISAGTVGAVTLKINGTSKNSNGGTYGSKMFADICDNAGNGSILNEVVTLSFNGLPIQGTLRGTCSVKTKTVTKDGTPFELSTTKITAKNI